MLAGELRGYNINQTIKKSIIRNGESYIALIAAKNRVITAGLNKSMLMREVEHGLSDRDAADCLMFYPARKIWLVKLKIRVTANFEHNFDEIECFLTQATNTQSNPS